MATSKIAVIGAGSWGTVVACLLAEAEDSTAERELWLWARDEGQAERMRRERYNERYLPGLLLPPNVKVTSSLALVVTGASVVVLAVPSRWARPVVGQVSGFAGPDVTLLSLAKGLEPGTLLTMSQLLAQMLPGRAIAVLSGPNLAGEIARGKPAATVIASADVSVTSALQDLFAPSRLRVYTHHDVIGCELAGAVKNVLALGAGMVDGMGAGDNARAALITRGLAELARLGVAMGGHPLTFSGLAGLGDLVLTCTSEHSRNRRVGLLLGQGASLGTVLSLSQQVAEGVTTAAAVVDLARRQGLEMPICTQVAAVLAGDRSPAQALEELLGREPGRELAGQPPWPGHPTPVA